MNDRLAPICFVPPAADTPWTGPPEESSAVQLRRGDGVEVELESRLFWYDPPWERIRIETSDLIATSVAQLGVCVSAMRSDLATPDGEPRLHEQWEAEAPDDGSEPERGFLPRMLPYRPERYGLNDRDFDGPRVIDVRLTMNRNSTGRFAFSPQQIERWEATPSNEPLAGGSWVPSATFPPDVDSMETLGFKLEQLRWLSPEAAIFVSLGPHRLGTELKAVLSTRPDGVILRLDELDLSGLQLAQTVQGTRRGMDLLGAEKLPLWIVPGTITPDDAVKLVALGANGIAIDRWCDEIMEQAIVAQQSAPTLGGYSSISSSREGEIVEMIEYDLAYQVERFEGLLHSLDYQPHGERLAALSEDWGQRLGISMLTLPFAGEG